MSVNALKARTEVVQYKLWKDHLLKKYPELSEDHETLLDTLEGITDVHEILETIGNAINEREIMVKGLKELIETYQARRSRNTTAIEKLKELMFYIMEECDLKSVPLPSMTISIAKTPQKVIITDEALLPKDFLVISPPEPNKKAILEALKQGSFVSGAMLSNGGNHLTIRRS